MPSRETQPLIIDYNDMFSTLKLASPVCIYMPMAAYETHNTTA